MTFAPKRIATGTWPTEHRIPRPKRPIPHSHYERVAAAYKHAVGEGTWKPGQLISEHSGVPKGTVNRWIAECRTRGLLTPTTPGNITDRPAPRYCHACGRPL